MRVLVCGGRDFKDKDLLEKELDKIHEPKFFNPGNIKLLIQGGASGADYLAREWASTKAVGVRTFKADWYKYRLRAGPIRNKQMLDEGKPDLVIAFPGGKGTADMIRQATVAKVKVKIIKPRPYLDLPPIKYTGI
jgi:YspA, cpYpsA-related SLOG family